MKASTWNKFVIGGTLAVLILLAAATIIIDPFWHYHAALGKLQYPLKDERYINDGIARHYDYSAVITGTSMSQNFSTSQFEELWGVKTIKTAFSGASYKEINDNIVRTIGYHPDIKYVLRSLDANRLIYPAFQDEYEGYPDYFFDNNPFNDVYYLLNKEVIPKTLAVINYTRAGNQTPSMDQYGSWSQYKVFGKEEVYKTRQHFETPREHYALSEQDYINIKENVQKNVLDVANSHPEITFYVFFPPYSICYWEALAKTNQLNMQLEAEQLAVKLLLEAENIHVFYFAENIDMISNLDNYTDALHYGEWVNSDILKWIHNGEYELTKENYEQYFNEISELYSTFDYASVLD